jgi:hypothetical protein
VNRRISSSSWLAVPPAVLVLCLWFAQGAMAQQPGGAPLPQTLPLAPDDTTGFESIFDGTLRSWDGDPTFWRAEGGMIIGESTPERVVERNTFLIYRGSDIADFELKLQFRLDATNSGIQFRSQERPEIGRWVLAGYQADMDFINQYTGNIHDERGRAFLAPRGQITRGVEGSRPRMLGSLGDNTDLRGHVNVLGWNQVHLIGRGNTLIYILNGRVTSIFIDDDTVNRDLTGVLGIQMHTGPPMRIELRNLYLKQYGEAVRK